MGPMGGEDGFKDTINLYIVDPVDTMAILLQWAMLYLAYFPDVQKKLRDVIDKVAVMFSCAISIMCTLCQFYEVFVMFGQKKRWSLCEVWSFTVKRLTCLLSRNSYCGLTFELVSEIRGYTFHNCALQRADDENNIVGRPSLTIIKNAANI